MHIAIDQYAFDIISIIQIARYLELSLFQIAKLFANNEEVILSVQNHRMYSTDCLFPLTISQYQNIHNRLRLQNKNPL